MALVQANPLAFYNMTSGIGDAVADIGKRRRDMAASQNAAQAFDQWSGNYLGGTPSGAPNYGQGTMSGYGQGGMPVRLGQLGTIVPEMFATVFGPPATKKL